VRAGTPQILGPKSPTVALSRVQSGVGAITIEAACSDAVGDLRLGAAYRLSNGVSSVVQHETGVTTGPAKGTRPVLHGGRGQFERITIDLAQVRSLDRLAVYGFSAAGGPLSWGGTLIVSTFGGSRVELPMDSTPSAGVLVFLTVYNVDGELVLRAEPHEVAPTVRDACLAYGFDRITWLDPRTPVV
jgi:hypothetical protein